MRSSRRDFLKVSTLATAPMFVPAHVLGKDEKKVAPSERIRIAAIGVGGKGRHNAWSFIQNKDAEVVAICDVDKAHLKKAQDDLSKRAKKAKIPFHSPKEFADFRELLKTKDINAVCVSTPDHWHGLASVAAANAKKDIYCEKPLTNSVAEGRAVCDAVSRNKVILQTGSHERSNDRARFAADLVRNGYLGEVKKILIQMPTEQKHHKQVKDTKDTPASQDVPQGFDWNFWLGHTKFQPYHPLRGHFWWRFILAHGGGEMTDRGAHIIDLAQLAAGKDDTGPVKIEAKGWNNHNGFYDAFMDYTFKNTYANGLVMEGSTKGPRGLKFIGSEGTLFVNVHGCKLEASNPKLLSVKLTNAESTVGRSPGHHRNFLDCVKSRKQPVAHAEIGHRTGTICHLNNIAMKVGRPIKWDPATEQILGDKEANALLAPKMRSPWKL